MKKKELQFMGALQKERKATLLIIAIIVVLAAISAGLYWIQ